MEHCYQMEMTRKFLRSLTNSGVLVVNLGEGGVSSVCGSGRLKWVIGKMFNQFLWWTGGR